VERRDPLLGEKRNKLKRLDLVAPESDLPRLEAALQEKPALIIDGLFGIGLNRPLDEAWQKIISAVNAARIPVLAVDVPSGLNADTGETFGACIQAAVTLTVGAPKIGMLAEAAWPFVGRLEVADDVGLIPCPLPSELNWTLPQDFSNFLTGGLTEGLSVGEQRQWRWARHALD